jgi:hypothetical protein
MQREMEDALEERERRAGEAEAQYQAIKDLYDKVCYELELARETCRGKSTHYDILVETLDTVQKDNGRLLAEVTALLSCSPLPSLSLLPLSYLSSLTHTHTHTLSLLPLSYFSLPLSYLSL